MDPPDNQDKILVLNSPLQGGNMEMPMLQQNNSDMVEK